MHLSTTKGADDMSTEQAITRHTPGPWAQSAAVANNRRDQVRINGADGLEIAVAVQLHDRRADKTAAFYEAHANARLIAASPDALELLAYLASDMWGAAPTDVGHAKRLAKQWLSKAVGSAA
jgi:hypothetical protein